MSFSLAHLWETMGWFARGIVIVLFAMSALSGSVALRKMAQLSSGARATRRFREALDNAMNVGDYAAAARAARDFDRSPVAGQMRAVFSDDGSVPRAGATERALDRNQILEMASLRRGLGVLATVAGTAPFVGLLGTVIGIVNAFSGMATAGTTGLSAISAGIAEALVTTALGLLVAIPAIWLYNYFINRIEFAGMEMQFEASRLADRLDRHGEFAPTNRLGEAGSEPSP
jgi:biopolymer transport protein ExbB/TolQ